MKKQTKDNLWILFLALCLTAAATMSLWIKAFENK